jgi:hypothetical protein
VQLRQICERAFADRYANANGHKRNARRADDDEFQLIRRLGLQVLPLAPGGARAGA